MSLPDRIFAAIDSTSLWLGKAVAFLLLPIAGVMVYEVVARYVFNAPTVWSTEIVEILAGTLYIFGGLYTQYLRGHISVDTLYNMLSPRWRTAMRVFVHSPLFFLYFGVLLYAGTDFAWDSVQGNERSGTLWNPIIWPVKLLVPIGAFLIPLQGLAQFARDVRELVSGNGADAGSTEEAPTEL